MLFRKIGVLKSRDTVPKIHVSEPTRPPGFSTLLTQLIDGVLRAKFYLANDYFVANYAKLAGKQAIGGTKVISMYSMHTHRVLQKFRFFGRFYRNAALYTL